MNSPFPQPVRSSLTQQTVSALRERIASGHWQKQLPGERELCELLQVSRITIRSALKVLEQEGLLNVSQGARRTVASGGKRRRQPRTSPVVRVLNPETFLEMSPSSLYLINEMHRSLEKSGYRISVESPPWINYSDPTRYLGEYVRRHPAACWALFSMPAAIQQWFSRTSLPAIVSGSCFEGVHLPSIDFDYRAVTHHAIGQFARRGYQRIVLLIPEKFRPGNTVTIDAFNEELSRPRKEPLEGSVVNIPSDETALNNVLRQLTALPSPSAPRTGIYIVNTLRALHVVSLLTRQGHLLGTPDCRFGVISRDEDFYLEHLVPSPTRYRLHKKTFATRFCRMLLQLARTGSLPAKPVLIIPEFHAGETV